MIVHSCHEIKINFKCNMHNFIGERDHNFQKSLCPLFTDTCIYIIQFKGRKIKKLLIFLEQLLLSVFLQLFFFYTYSHVPCTATIYEFNAIIPILEKRKWKQPGQSFTYRESTLKVSGEAGFKSKSICLEVLLFHHTTPQFRASSCLFMQELCEQSGDNLFIFPSSCFPQDFLSL